MKILTKTYSLAITIVLLHCVIFSSCSTVHNSQTDQTIQLIEQTANTIAQNAKSYEGKSKELLLRDWGMPVSVFNDGPNGKIYYYTHSSILNSGVLTIYINMFIDNNGIVSHSNVKHMFYPNPY